MNREQIKKRLAALNQYEASLHRNTWDDYDRVTDELLKVMSARSGLTRMLHELREEISS